MNFWKLHVEACCCQKQYSQAVWNLWKTKKEKRKNDSTQKMLLFSKLYQRQKGLGIFVGLTKKLLNLWERASTQTSQRLCYLLAKTQTQTPKRLRITKTDKDLSPSTKKTACKRSEVSVILYRTAGISKIVKKQRSIFWPKMAEIIQFC